MHTAEYVEAFTSGQLDDARVKRIGFGGDVTRSPVLINRTLAEVAGDCTLQACRSSIDQFLRAGMSK